MISSKSEDLPAFFSAVSQEGKQFDDPKTRPVPPWRFLIVSSTSWISSKLPDQWKGPVSVAPISEGVFLRPSGKNQFTLSASPPKWHVAQAIHWSLDILVSSELWNSFCPFRTALLAEITVDSITELTIKASVSTTEIVPSKELWIYISLPLSLISIPLGKLPTSTCAMDFFDFRSMMVKSLLAAFATYKIEFWRAASNGRPTGLSIMSSAIRSPLKWLNLFKSMIETKGNTVLSKIRFLLSEFRIVFGT